MYPAYKLNQQGDNIQVWRTPFPIWNQSVVPCPVLVGLLKENWSFQGFNFYYLEQDLSKSIVTRPFEDRRLIFLSLINLSKIWLLFRYTWLWETSAKGKKKKKNYVESKKTQWNQEEIKEQQNTLSQKSQKWGCMTERKMRTLILNYPVCTTTLSVSTDDWKNTEAQARSYIQPYTAQV